MSPNRITGQKYLSTAAQSQILTDIGENDSTPAKQATIHFLYFTSGCVVEEVLPITDISEQNKKDG